MLDGILTENMVCPALCECGNWYDGNSAIACRPCIENEGKERDEIAFLQGQIYWLSLEPGNEVEIEKIQKQIDLLNQ